MNRIDVLLNAVIEGETLPDFIPPSRVEAYLKACLAKSGTEGLPVPVSRLDALLFELADVMSEGATPVKADIAQAVDGSIEALTAADLAGAVRIRDYAFYGLEHLKSVEIPGSVLTICNRAFAYCSALESITIPANVTEIEGFAFRKCDALRMVTIESQSITIGSAAFNVGTSTAKFTVKMLATVPPSIQTTSFNEANLEKIIVPAGCGEAYRTAPNWTEYAAFIKEESAAQEGGTTYAKATVPWRR